MKKAEMIAQANKGYNKVWDLVDILEEQGRVKKTDKIRKPAVYISENQELLNLSETEILIVDKESAIGKIVNYRLLSYDLFSGKVEGAYNPSLKK